MSVDLNSARYVLPEDSVLKNSTLGLDSGLASSADLSHSSGDQSIIRRSRLSNLSSIPGPVPHVG